MNLFASLKEVFTENTVTQIAVKNGEKPEKIQKAFDALGASIVAGLIKRVTTESGMNLVFNQVQKITFVPQEISTIFSDQAAFDALKLVGEKDLNTVLPGLKSSVTNMVAKYAGTRNSLASSMCGITVAIVMSVLKHKVAEKRLDAVSLAAYLGDQREGLLNAVPDITDVLIEATGIQYLLQNFNVPKTETSGLLPNSDENTPAPKHFLANPELNQPQVDLRPYFKWIGIAILLISVLVAGIYYWNQYQSQSDDSETDPILTEARTIEEPMAKDSLEKIPVPAASATELGPMAKYLADSNAIEGKAFKFENVDFEDNTTQLKTTANTPVQELVDLLKNHPNSQIKLVDYANDAKLPLTNKALSVKRAIALKDQFIKAGINNLRVDAEGRGTGINPKDTTGRKQAPMREIWVRFVQK